MLGKNNTNNNSCVKIVFPKSKLFMSYHSILKHLIILFSVIVFAACKTNSSDYKAEGNKSDTTSANAKPVDDGKDPEYSDSENYANYFIVIADTGFNYSSLDNKMFLLKKITGIPIDTMERYYDASKNLIVLPDTSEDEIYAGDYFPRRDPSANLSLEYMNFYQPSSAQKMIALVTGIYESEKSADSALAIIRRVEKKAFIIKSKIYIGCMH